jgi:hypothetical protein
MRTEPPSTVSPGFEHTELGISAQTPMVSPGNGHAELGISARRHDAGRAVVAGAESATLAARQAALVAALVAGEPDPTGFDPDRLAATRRALLRKRASEAASAWPVLAASLGHRWSSTFAAHHAGREPGGALRDGWDLAGALRAELTSDASAELAEREALLRYDGKTAPRPRRLGWARRTLARLTRPRGV